MTDFAPEATPNPTGGLDGNPAYRAAFESVLSAPTPQARAAGIREMERIAAGGAPAPQPLDPAAAARRADLVSRMDASTSPVYRERLADELADMGNAGLPPASAAPAVPEGFEPPGSPSEYVVSPQARGAMAKGAEAEQALGEILTGAHAAGVPAAMFAHAMDHAAANAGLLADASRYADAVSQAKAVIVKQAGEDARGVFGDAARYLDALELHVGGEAVALLCTSPVIIRQAADLWRSGARPAAPKRN